ncbi:ferric reductase-like transmembrane domain-containing protein [Jiangella endophytica]|uniref:ferric reductase-like transmembrane domain-containing protein n=1 Tax=Jiangella endophytica TaxID=1623398 RepID=UPI000E35449D|nr:ferric reductase-like transmembrane domain-containing protein [Jiangella endophytica]
MNEALWAAGRASGVTALALLTASVVLGVLNRSGRPLPGLPRFSIALVHRDVALAATAFVGVHVLTLLFDPLARLSVTDLLMPFAGAFRPFWQGLGTVAFDVLLAVVVTALLRHRLGLRTYRTVHWLVYAMWPVAFLHAVGNGTDARTSWFLEVAAVSLIAVTIAVVWRLSAWFVESSHARQELR